jgi:hypothetical protein
MWSNEEETMKRPRKVRFLVLLALVVLTGMVGCDWIKSKLKDVEKTEQTQQRCDARIEATGERHKIPDPVKPTTCFGIMLCNYCEYDEHGEFIESGFDACGVCLSEKAN